MGTTRETEYVHTVIIGAGQAGLAVAYQLAQRDVPFVVLEANQRIGDNWRKRWDSLRLFTAARYDGIAGMPFPAPRHEFPTKDEMGDYLEEYARRFKLPVRTGVKVESVSRQGARYVVTTDDRRYEAEHVVVAMANYQNPRIPSFAGELAPEIVQLHSSQYRNPAQLRTGGVLIVGAGNSGAEIAKEVVRAHPTWVSGRDTGHVPFRPGSPVGRHLMTPFLLRFVFHRVLTTRTPMGRKARAGAEGHGTPLIRVKPADLVAAGVNRVERTTGVQNGLPVLEGGRVLDVANVIWCTGFQSGFSSWIDVAAFGPKGEPLHERGVVATEPGLYFVGLHFLYAFSSVMIHGVSRDAEHIAKVIKSRSLDVASRRVVRNEPAGSVYAGR
jgi:putative flavoprotein involved in K+ transport